MKEERELLHTCQIEIGDIVKIIWMSYHYSVANELAGKGIGVGSIVQVSDVDPNMWSGIYVFDINGEVVNLGSPSDDLNGPARLRVIRATQQEESLYHEIKKPFKMEERNKDA